VNSSIGGLVLGVFVVIFIALFIIGCFTDDKGKKERLKLQEEQKRLLASQAAEQKEYDRRLAHWHSEWRDEVEQADWIPKGSVGVAVSIATPPKAPSFLTTNHYGLTAKAQSDVEAIFSRHNRDFERQQRVELKKFFESVEKKPLTDEQIAACICMDDNVQIVASAGSGKTSTMVAKAGYAIHRKIAAPGQILMLAFNKDAAEELGQRVAERLKGFEGIEKVVTRTFHAFGLDVIGAATGKKPSLAEWAEPGRDIQTISEIIDHLDRNDSEFSSDWLRFRVLYGSDILRPKTAGVNPSHSDPEYIYTASGIPVKSAGEKAIADWLYYHGVKFEYERDYEHETASASHRQYKPDFYYPDIDVYHEHWATTDRASEGRFTGYVDGLEWKRALHKRNGTTLIETTFEQFQQGTLSTVLTQRLKELGLAPAFDPKLLEKSPPDMNNPSMARLVRIFQQHAKGNGLNEADLKKSAAEQAKTGYKPRIDLFLKLYLNIASEWESRLRRDRSIDFDDMLGQAATHIEAGRYKSSFEIVLADEFQDSSRARIRLLKALTKTNGAHLCVVGDDWQGINRFAGADISVMMEFDKVFEDATVLKLGTTFRCPQSLCDISSSFIQKNPAQIRKTVRAYGAGSSLPNGLATAVPIVEVRAYRDDMRTHADLKERIREMHSQARLMAYAKKTVKVLILGRYKSDEPKDISTWCKRYGDRLDIGFRTIHSSKGAESDHVIILNMVQGIRGFPSAIQDDSLLQIPMPAPDNYPWAEERRLFYVALTRARSSVTIYTSLDEPSQFLLELEKTGDIEIKAMDGTRACPCPKCGRGTLKQRSGKYGAFYGCSTFPTCSYTNDNHPGYRSVSKSYRPKDTRRSYSTKREDWQYEPNDFGDDDMPF
jgi:DNA helicase-4